MGPNENIFQKKLSKPENKFSMTSTQLMALEAESSSNTTLISYYVNYSPQNSISTFIRNELSQSANIKSKQTRTQVQASLRAIARLPAASANIPLNGLAIFSGNGQCV